MTLTFLSALCALALHATPAPGMDLTPGPLDAPAQTANPGSLAAPAPADTVDTYLIDNQPIAHFNGSQLEGKTIVSYRIGRIAGQAKRVHIITTSAGSGVSQESLKIVDDLKKASEPLILINGIESERKTFNALDPNRIESVNVFKTGSEKALAFGEKGANGVILVQLKDGDKDLQARQSIAIGQNDILYVIDGKKTTKEAFERLEPEQIKNMTVLKKGSEAARKLYDTADKTVLVITTKK